MSSDLRIVKDTYVQFSYEITTLSGEVVERSDLPLTTVFGRHNRLYDRIERAMAGTGKGDSVSVELAPKECAWGDPNPRLIFEDDMSNVPPEHRYLGAEIQFHNEKGEAKTFRVTKVTDNKITIDGNHPFAGQSIIFQVKVLEVRKATGEELVEGIKLNTEAVGEIPPGTLH